MLDLFMCQWSNQGYVKGRAQNYAEGGSKNILRARVQIYLKNSPDSSRKGRESDTFFSKYFEKKSRKGLRPDTPCNILRKRYENLKSNSFNKKNYIINDYSIGMIGMIILQ